MAHLHAILVAPQSYGPGAGLFFTWTEDGVLHAAAISPEGLGAPRVLLDTRDMTFERRIAPY